MIKTILKGTSLFLKTGKFLCYASWCGPCKRVNQDVYPSDSVEAARSDHFVSATRVSSIIRCWRRKKETTADTDWPAAVEVRKDKAN